MVVYNLRSSPTLLYKREKTEIVKGEIIRRVVYFNKYGDEVEKAGDVYTVKKANKKHKNEHSFEFPNIYQLFDARNQQPSSSVPNNQPYQEVTSDMVISIFVGLILFLSMWFLLAYSIGFRQGRKQSTPENSNVVYNGAIQTR